MEFDEARHLFTANGDKVISVTACTSVIDKSGPLIYWAVGLARDFLLGNIKGLVKDTKGDDIVKLIEEASKQHRIKKQEAADVGTQVHKWVELFIKAKTDNDRSLFDRAYAVREVEGGVHLVRGLTTASSLWVVAALGLSIGCGFFKASIFVTFIVLVVLLFLRRFEKRLLKKGGTDGSKG